MIPKLSKPRARAQILKESTLQILMTAPNKKILRFPTKRVIAQTMHTCSYSSIVSGDYSGELEEDDFEKEIDPQA